MLFLRLVFYEQPIHFLTKEKTQAINCQDFLFIDFRPPTAVKQHPTIADPPAARLYESAMKPSATGVQPLQFWEPCGMPPQNEPMIGASVLSNSRRFGPSVASGFMN
jgi:hypothetical protein